ncbi:MAG: CusA/CzcA family heavy metal efflux RND transporter [Spirochaetia bacterium]|nr:CusA/CzcA family heavy metal efflux RND transporter [Spirochaetia bacterium]
MIDRIIDFSARNKFLVITVFFVLAVSAYFALKKIPLDALPDLSDTQVIVYSRWNRSADIMEDQVTYPIITSLLGAPRVKTIRGLSDFGYSYVYVIFEDGTDIYWARSRILEYMSKISGDLPDGVKTEIGPDATGVGWVYQYALLDESGKHDRQELRSFQDWFLKFQLQSVPGVSEVASIGGYVKQYQIQINPSALIAYDIPLTSVMRAVRRSNSETGGRVFEMAGREYMIRGRGYLKSVKDIEDIAVGVDARTGTPVTVKHIASVEIGPQMRRGVADFNGRGDTAGGIVIMRHGENALNVINRVKNRIEEIAPSFPEGVKLIPTYDRSSLIEQAIATLRATLIEEIIVVSLMILFFLRHIPSASVAIITIPVSVLLAFLPLYFMGMTTNIMSLAGIAISIGVLVDGAIVEVENAYKKIEKWIASGAQGDFHEVRISAMKEVGPSVFYSLLVIAVAFIPIFTLVDQEGRLFKPLAYSKNLTMAIAAILAITLDPAVRMLFSRYKYVELRPEWLSKIVNTVFIGKYYPEERHPVSRILFRLYEPVCRYTLIHSRKFIAGALLLMAATVPVYLKMGSEFMPPLQEGSILYMPTTLPGISVTEASRILQIQDRILKSFPEVDTVFGKAGRADTSTDSAPFSMVETTVILKPESEWRKVDRWYSFLPDFIHAPFRLIWSDTISFEELENEMDRKLAIPGWSNSAFTKPIQGRIDMLTTGIRTPVGIKVFGNDVKQIEVIGQEIEKLVRPIEGARNPYAERTAGGYYLDFQIRRRELARYGLSVDDVQEIISSAVGGESLTTTIEGRERYSVNVRYARDYRNDIEKLKRVLLPVPSGAHIPISAIAEIVRVSGPSMIRNENGLLAGYVFIDIKDRDVGSFVSEAKQVLRENLFLPPGYSIRFSGQYENMIRVKERLTYILPLTVFLIFLLIYMNTKSAVKTGMVLLAVPFSMIGAVWLLWILDYQISIAVWVGMIALMGLDAETGSFMLLFLDLAYKERKENGRLHTEYDLIEAIVEGAVKRIRPKIMTVGSAIIGLLPVMWATGLGSDVMKRIAAPMVGGLVTSFLLELLIYPVLFFLWKRRELALRVRDQDLIT